MGKTTSKKVKQAPAATTGKGQGEPLASVAALSPNYFGDVSVTNAIPATWEERARKAVEYYHEEPLVSNALNAWRTFALGDVIGVSCEDEKVQEEAQDAFERLGLNRFVKDMVLQLLIKGDAIGYCLPSKGCGDVAQVICVNPISVTLESDGQVVTAAIQKPQNLDGSYGDEIVLDLERMLHLKWNAPEFEARGNSMVLPAFEAIELLRDYRKAERAIAKRWTTPLRFIQVGGAYGNRVIQPDQKTIEKVRDELERADLKSGLVVPFYVKAETYGADGKALDTDVRMKEVKEDILVALGMSRSIVTGDGPNFATASVSMQKMIVQLKEIKQMARIILDWVFDDWRERVGHEEDLHYQFSDLDLTAEVAQKQLLVELYDRGLISKNTLQQKMGLSPEVESKEQEEEEIVVDTNWSVEDIAKLVALEVLTVDEARDRLGLEERPDNADETAARLDVGRIYSRQTKILLGSRVLGDAADDEEIAKNDADLWKRALLSIFHHIHHKGDGAEVDHEVHHCGGEHAKKDPTVDYQIEHCSCQLHRIDKQSVLGHATKSNLDLLTVRIGFTEKCPDGGWHIESGKVSDEKAKASILAGETHGWRFTPHSEA